MIAELRARLTRQQGYKEQCLRAYVARERGIDVRTISCVETLRRSIDARQRTVYVNVSLRIYINEAPPALSFTPIELPSVEGRPSVVVVGAGPGGLFAALRLIALGLRPIVVERGKTVSQRNADIASIRKTQQVDPESNYSFGEGGAGAFSDGKLYTRSKKRGPIDKVLHLLCQHGASTTILADAHPHIGTDRLPKVIERIRQSIIEAGGEVHFQCKMTSLLLTNGRISGVQCGEKEFLSPAVILATGHSARDVYRMLHSQGIAMEAKGLAVGVRLEHPSALIDKLQYHSPQGRGAYLPAAEYTYTTQAQGRGVYSFCMCPGGFVVPAATGPEQIVVNGMSPANRGSAWSNSGMVVELRPEDVEGTSPLRMLEYQESLERQCWLQGNRQQTAPAQRMADFVNRRLSYDLPRSSYGPGLISSPLHFWMPAPIVERLQEAFRTFGRQRHGFLTNDAVCIGVESRTSSPLRITRTPDLHLVTLPGLFPCGEGAGYAGGIVSAAIDGQRCADSASEYLRQ